eukprot:gene36076-59114_t
MGRKPFAARWRQSRESAPIQAGRDSAHRLVSGGLCSGIQHTRQVQVLAVHERLGAPQQVAPGSLRAVLDAALAAAPGLSHYVLDDQGHIRKHVAVFINQTMVMDRQTLTQPLASGDSVLVIQALTGG